MEQMIAGNNTRVLENKSEDENHKKCSCPKEKKQECPFDNKCLEKGTPNSEVKTYIGLPATDFKSRYGFHNKGFSDPSYWQTTLCMHILELKDQGIAPKIT